MNCIEAWHPTRKCWVRYCQGQTYESMIEAACIVVLLRDIAPDIMWRVGTA